ncbi:MAG TPA: hypothetical protein VKA84_12680, partial [Gemmatimonadaceae bacterium]|nr:hypothetical protein [Gemmatimonadaceae bacterium]
MTRGEMRVRTGTLGDRVATAAAAAAVVVLVPGLIQLAGAEHFERDVSGYFDLGRLGGRLAAAAALVFSIVLLWRTRGLAGLWAAVAGGYIVRIAGVLWGEDLLAQPWEYVCVMLMLTLWDAFWQWTPLITGLFLAGWVARFRDARAGFGALLLPGALWALAGW